MVGLYQRPNSNVKNLVSYPRESNSIPRTTKHVFLPTRLRPDPGVVNFINLNLSYIQLFLITLGIPIIYRLIIYCPSKLIIFKICNKINL